VGTELPQQARAVDAGLLEQLALCRLVERLLRALEAAGDRPHALEGRDAAADEQDVQPPLRHRQDDDVDCDRERRELVRVVGSCLHDHYATTGLWSFQPKPGYAIAIRSIAARARGDLGIDRHAVLSVAQLLGRLEPYLRGARGARAGDQYRDDLLHGGRVRLAASSRAPFCSTGSPCVTSTRSTSSRVSASRLGRKRCSYQM